MSGSREGVELVIRPRWTSTTFRAPLVRVLTTVGSTVEADVQVPGSPPHWALVQRTGDEFILRRIAASDAYPLVPGREVVLDDVAVSIAAPPGARLQLMQPLTGRLSEAENPEEVLSFMLRGVLEATDADSGAVILRSGEAYTVATAEDRAGGRLPEAEALLSDHIVREVLERATPVVVEDAAHQERYAEIPSVVALRLRTILCVPLLLYGKPIGAVFLGRKDAARAFSTRQADDLGLLAAMFVPLLVQLRRFRSGTPDASALLVGDSEAIHAVLRSIERVGPSDLSVLVVGETGTGKELVARSLHASGSRAGRPMIAINCSAIPESLLAAELFGCRKGAYTGASADRKGCIEQAHGSTLFLDEVGDMPGPMQASLLRVLENREVVRLGETQPRPVDFRLVAATHADLDAAVAQGRFRQDLLFRLREFTIRLPSLSERGSDIVLLAQFFLRQSETQLGLPPRRLGRLACDRLLRHPWPGNVRELRAAVRRAAVLCDGPEIQPEHLGLDPPVPQASEPIGAGASSASSLGDTTRPLEVARQEFVERYVAAALERHGGDRAAAASALGISLRSLYRCLSSRR